MAGAVGENLYKYATDTRLPQFYYQFCIKTVQDTYLRHINEEVGMSTECNRDGHWRLWRMIDGTVIMYPQDAPTRYLYTNRVGAVSIAYWRWVGRRWTPQKNEDGSWSFHSEGSIPDVTTSLSLSLSSVSQEKSKKSRCNRATLPGFFDKFCFKTVHGTYLRNLKDTELDTSEHCESNGRWRHWQSGDGAVAMSPADWKDYLGAKKDGSLDMVDWLGGDHQWLVRMNRHGSWSFRSMEGLWWLSADRNGTVYATRDDSSPNSFFWIESLQDPTPQRGEDSEVTQLNDTTMSMNFAASVASEEHLDSIVQSCLKSAHDTYLRYGEGGKVDLSEYCERSAQACGLWDFWTGQGSDNVLHVARPSLVSTAYEQRFGRRFRMASREKTGGWLNAGIDGTVYIATEEIDMHFWIETSTEYSARITAQEELHDITVKIVAIVAVILLICVAVYIILRRRRTMPNTRSTDNARKLDVDYHVVEDEHPQGVH